MVAMRSGLSIDPPLAEIPGVLDEEGVDAFQFTIWQGKRGQRFGAIDVTGLRAMARRRARALGVDPSTGHGCTPPTAWR